MSDGWIKKDEKIMWHRNLEVKCFTYLEGLRDLLKTLSIKYRISKIRRKYDDVCALLLCSQNSVYKSTISRDTDKQVSFMSHSLFWDVRRRRWVASNCLILQDETDMLSRNVGKQIPIYEV
jgi:hypothetical protein